MKPIVKQKILGAVLTALSVLSIIVTGGDATFACIGIPVGIVLAVTKTVIIEED